MNTRHLDVIKGLHELLERLSGDVGPKSLADLVALQTAVADGALLVRQLLGIEAVPGAVGIVTQHIGTLITVLQSEEATTSERRFAETMLAASWNYLMSMRRHHAEEVHQASLEAYEWNEPDVRRAASVDHVHEARATPIESNRYPGTYIYECECGAVGISSAASGGRPIWDRTRPVEADE